MLPPKFPHRDCGLRVIAAFLALSLALPPSALALRNEASKETGLEEDLRLALADPTNPLQAATHVITDRFTRAIGIPISPPIAAGVEEKGMDALITQIRYHMEIEKPLPITVQEILQDGSGAIVRYQENGDWIDGFLPMGLLFEDPLHRVSIEAKQEWLKERGPDPLWVIPVNLVSSRERPSVLRPIFSLRMPVTSKMFTGKVFEAEVLHRTRYGGIEHFLSGLLKEKGDPWNEILSFFSQVEWSNLEPTQRQEIIRWLARQIRVVGGSLRPALLKGLFELFEETARSPEEWHTARTWAAQGMVSAALRLGESELKSKALKMIQQLWIESLQWEARTREEKQPHLIGLAQGLDTEEANAWLKQLPTWQQGSPPAAGAEEDDLQGWGDRMEPFFETTVTVHGPFPAARLPENLLEAAHDLTRQAGLQPEQRIVLRLKGPKDNISITPTLESLRGALGYVGVEANRAPEWFVVVRSREIERAPDRYFIPNELYPYTPKTVSGSFLDRIAFAIRTVLDQGLPDEGAGRVPLFGLELIHGSAVEKTTLRSEQSHPEVIEPILRRLSGNLRLPEDPAGWSFHVSLHYADLPPLSTAPIVTVQLKSPEEKPAPIPSPAAGAEEGWTGFLTPADFGRILIWLNDQWMTGGPLSDRQDRITLQEVTQRIRTVLGSGEDSGSLSKVSKEKVTFFVDQLPYLITGQTEPVLDKLPRGYELTRFFNFFIEVATTLLQLRQSGALRDSATSRTMADQVLNHFVSTQLSNRPAVLGSSQMNLELADLFMTPEEQRQATYRALEVLMRPRPAIGAEEKGLPAEELAQRATRVELFAGQFGISIPEHSRIILFLAKSASARTPPMVNEVLDSLVGEMGIAVPHLYIPYPIPDGDMAEYKRMVQAIRQGITLPNGAKVVAAAVGAPFKLLEGELLSPSGDGQLQRQIVDAEAMADWFEETVKPLKGLRLVVLGLGGVGTAFIDAAERRGALEITVADPDQDKVQAVRLKARRPDFTLSVVVPDDPVAGVASAPLHQKIAQADATFNLSGIGRFDSKGPSSPLVEALEVPLRYKPGSAVVDSNVLLQKENFITQAERVAPKTNRYDGTGLMIGSFTTIVMKFLDLASSVPVDRVRVKTLVREGAIRHGFLPAAGAEEAETPVRVQRVLDVLGSKISNVNRLKDKKYKNWAREATGVADMLRNTLPLLRTVPSGNALKDEEIKSRVSVFLKRAEDLLKEVPAAGAEEELSRQMAALLKLERGKDSVRNGKWKRLIEYLEQAEPVLLKTLLENPRQAMTKEREAAWKDQGLISGAGAGKLLVGDLVGLRGKAEKLLEELAHQKAKQKAQEQQRKLQEEREPYLRQARWVTARLGPAMKQLVMSDFQDDSALRQAGEALGEESNNWLRAMDELRVFIQQKSLGSVRPLNPLELLLWHIQWLDDHWFSERGILVTTRPGTLIDNPAEVAEQLAAEAIQERREYVMLGRHIHVYSVKPLFPGKETFHGWIPTGMIVWDPQTVPLLEEEMGKVDQRLLGDPGRQLRALAARIQQRYADQASYANFLSEDMLFEELRHAMDFTRLGQAMREDLPSVTFDSTPRIIEHLIRPTGFLRQVWDQLGTLPQVQLAQARVIYTNSLIELSGQATKAAMGPHPDYTLMEWFRTILQTSQLRGGVPYEYAVYGTASVLGIQLLAHEMGLAPASSEPISWLSPDPADIVLKVQRISERPTEEIRLAIKRFYEREFITPFEEPPFHVVSPDGRLGTSAAGAEEKWTNAGTAKTEVFTLLNRVASQGVQSVELTIESQPYVVDRPGIHFTYTERGSAATMPKTYSTDTGGIADLLEALSKAEKEVAGPEIHLDISTAEETLAGRMQRIVEARMVYDEAAHKLQVTLRRPPPAAGAEEKIIFAQTRLNVRELTAEMERYHPWGFDYYDGSDERKDYLGGASAISSRKPWEGFPTLNNFIQKTEGTLFDLTIHRGDPDVPLDRTYATIIGRPTAGAEEGAQVRAVEDLSVIAPELAAEAQAAGRTHAVLLPVEAVGTKPESSRIDLYAHESVSAGAMAILPEAWRIEIKHVMTLPLDNLEQTNKLLQQATDALTQGRTVAIALDASIREGLRLPRNHPVTFLLNPATWDKVDRAVLAAYLAKPNALLNLVLDLTAGSIRRVTIQGRDYYAIFA